MLTDAQRTHLAAVARTLQIIVGGLAWGVLLFGGVALLVTRDAAAGNGQPSVPLLTYLAAGVAVVSLVLSWVVPSIIASSQRQALASGKALPSASPTSEQPPAEGLDDVGPLAAMLQTRLIVGAAIWEGAAFFNLIAYIIEHQTLSLATAGMLVIFLLSRFPTRWRLEGWVESELAAIDGLRQLGRRDG